jgi:uncharacterized LabA/DUF88 family protein
MFTDTEAFSLFDPAKETTAVFIDFENMRLTVEETGEEPFQIGKVLEYVDQNIGRVTIKKAYSNWHYVNPHMYNLLGNNVDLVQIYTRGTQRKNAADIRLTADAMESLFLFPQVTTFVIVGSDSDYTGLIINLRKHGKKVVGIGTRQHTSEHLVRACNLFRFYRTIATDDPHTLRDNVGDMDMQEAKDLLQKAMQRHRFSDRPAVGRWLRWQMIQLAPSFDEADLGFANFREFLEACNDIIRMTYDDRFQEMKVELLAGQPKADSPDSPDTPLKFEAPAGVRDANSIVTLTERSSFESNYTGVDRHDEPQTFPTNPDNVSRTDYLRTLWAPRLYLYNREIAAPVITEIHRLNGPGSPMSQYELEEYLLGSYAEEFLTKAGLPHYELTQKTIYAIQKLLFWAGTMRFLEHDEHNYWKKRKREILPEFTDAQAMIESVDLALAKHFARHMPLVSDVLAGILQGGDTMEYAEKIIAATVKGAPPAPAETEETPEATT